MSKTLIGAVALIALGTGVAGAADMSVKAPPPPMPLPFSWTGFYFGGNIGAAWAQRDSQDLAVALAARGLGQEVKDGAVMPDIEGPEGLDLGDVGDDPIDAAGTLAES